MKKKTLSIVFLTVGLAVFFAGIAVFGNTEVGSSQANENMALSLSIVAIAIGCFCFGIGVGGWPTKRESKPGLSDIAIRAISAATFKDDQGRTWNKKTWRYE